MKQDYEIKRYRSLTALLATLLLASCGRPSGVVLQSDSGVIGRQELPAGTVVVDLAAVGEISGPFAKSADGAATVLTLPPGADQAVRDKPGMVTVTATVPVAGNYRGWLRAKWDDSCGNSVGFKCAKLPEKTVGQNAVYGRWHWVDVGILPLVEGEQVLELIQREDGVALDQLLLCPEATYQPGGRVEASGATADLRRFGDDFSRSPGHGMEQWQLDDGYELAFSFDPNRIPNQYALVAKASGPEMIVATPAGAVWDGCRLVMAFRPMTAGTYGVLLQHDNGSKRLVGLQMGDAGATAIVDGKRESLASGQVRLGEWHELVVEQWASVTRLLVDGVLLGEVTSAPWLPVQPALVAQAGECVFDDLRITEIPWAGEGDGRRLPWAATASAQKSGWRRPEAKARWQLYAGEAAAPLRLAHPDYLPAELLTRTSDSAEVTATVTNLTPVTGAAVTLNGGAEPTYYERVAIRFRTPEVAREVVFGPYHFTEAAIEDPSDYLDFTTEEYEAMQASGEWDKLKRRPKFRPVVSADNNEAVWIQRGGRARVRNGVLYSDPRHGALVEHFRGFAGKVRLSLRMKLGEDGTLWLRPYGIRKEESVKFVARANADGIQVAADAWQALEVELEPGQATIVAPVALDKVLLPATTSGAFRLQMLGDVLVDDVTIRVAAGDETGGLYEFASRETDWWRPGDGWVDHAGISCTLASSWITLINESDEVVTSWLKQPVAGDLVVGAYLQEYSKWYGWRSRPSHEHKAYDNVMLCLGTANNPDVGYQLVVNRVVDRRRRQTVLIRNGEIVASIDQDRTFPIRYVGGHEPYQPRSNGIRLYKRGGTLVATVNDREVLRYIDPEPIEINRVGFGGGRTHANFCHVEVLPLTVDAAVAAQQ